jgi:hypothetical protein
MPNHHATRGLARAPLQAPRLFARKKKRRHSDDHSPRRARASPDALVASATVEARGAQTRHQKKNRGKTSQQVQAAAAIARQNARTAARRRGRRAGVDRDRLGGRINDADSPSLEQHARRPRLLFLGHSRAVLVAAERFHRATCPSFRFSRKSIVECAARVSLLWHCRESIAWKFPRGDAPESILSVWLCGRRKPHRARLYLAPSLFRQLALRFCDRCQRASEKTCCACVQC